MEEQLLEAEKQIKDIFSRQPYLREAVYAIQVAVSSMHPGAVRYNLIISQLADQIDDIRVSVESMDNLFDIIKQLDGKLDRDALRRMYIESRIQGYKNRITAAEEELTQLDGTAEQ